MADTEERRQDNRGDNNGNNNTIMGFLLGNKYDACLWCLRLYIIFCVLCYIVPLLGAEFGQSCFKRVLIGSAAISALRLHQRLPRIQFNMAFGRTLILEDSFHYLAYSVLFLMSNAATMVLMPIAIFAVMHAASYTRKVIEIGGGNNAIILKIRQLIGKIEDRETHTQMLMFIATTEIMVMPVSILMIFSGQSTILVPFIYYRFLQLRYASRRNPYSRLQILIGIGGKLQEPCLLQGQELNGGRISRLFAQKIIWLHPVSDIPNTFFSEETIQPLITDLLPASVDIGNTFDELSNTYNSEILPVLSEHNVQQIQEIVPDTPRNVTETALSRAKNINDAVDSMINDTFNSNNFNSNDISNHTNKITGLLSPADVVIEYRDQKLKVGQTCSLHVNRCNLWREVIHATGSMEKLTFPLDVTFVGENGIDAGALKAELFTKVFEQAKQELFERAEENLAFAND